MVIVSASTFGIICLVVLLIALGGANAVGSFIATNMTTILVIVSILYTIRLIILSFNKFGKESNSSMFSNIFSILLQIAESAFAVFACYKALMHLVMCAEEMGFFKFGIELILWALFIATPLLGGTAIGTLLSWYSNYSGIAVSSICYLFSTFLS